MVREQLTWCSKQNKANLSRILSAKNIEESKLDTLLLLSVCVCVCVCERERERERERVVHCSHCSAVDAKIKLISQVAVYGADLVWISTVLFCLRFIPPWMLCLLQSVDLKDLISLLFE